ncbi:restriction endonuclease subunit S [Vibrio vulnificus]|uniref:restriction endonuclease subunit S n=1 Tax=Vibrio vulnificus TaxID=672 RepID=UPI00102C6B7E|nr:restriction endonuclease subunit S [Vibrio vulnificus]RZR40297.1 restriction endonuclease subunit S [Vibrio vulnificus]
MVPNGWEYKKLKDISVGKLNNGIFNDPKLVGSGYKLINVVDIYEPLEINISKLRKLNASEKDFEKFKVKYGDLFFTRSSLKLDGIAHCARYRSKETDVMWECHIMRCTPNKEIVESNFLYEYCHSFQAKRHFMRFAKTGTMTTIDQSGIGELIVPIPPLPEQRKIAQILSTWDKAITTTEKLIDASKQQKKSLMQQLLTGKKRLVNPETGKAFEGEWEEVKLSKVFARVTEKNKGQSTNVVTISAQHGLIRQEEFFKKSIASETLDNYFILRKGQFAYNKSYSNGYPMGAIKRLNRYDDAVVTSLYICFEIKNSAHTSSCFMEQYFESGLLNRGLTKVAAEGGRAHGLLNVKPTDFMGLALVVPEIKEQQRIASVLTATDKEIELLEAKLAHLKQEKKALMQQLLTGKRRVSLSS